MRINLLMILLMSLMLNVRAQRIELLNDTIYDVYSVNLANHSQKGIHVVRTQDGSTSGHFLVVSRVMGSAVVDLDTLRLVDTSAQSLNVVNAFFTGNRLYIFGPQIRDLNNNLYSGSLFWDDKGFHKLTNDFPPNRIGGESGGTSLGPRLYYAPNPAALDSVIYRGVISFDTITKTFHFEYAFIESYRNIRSLGDSLFILGKRYGVNQEYIFIVSNGQVLDSLKIGSCNYDRPILQSDSIFMMITGSDSLVFMKNGTLGMRALGFSNCNLHDVAYINDSFFFMDNQYLQGMGATGLKKGVVYNLSLPDSIFRLDLEQIAGELYIAGVSVEGSMFIGKVHRGPSMEISGNAYFDLNGNCLRDTQDFVRDIYIGLANTKFGARVMPSGSYQFFVKGISGPQILTSAKGEYETAICSNDSLVIVVNGDDTLLKHNYTFYPNQIDQDHRIDITSGEARRGEWMYLNVSLLKTAHAQLQPVSLSLEADSRVIADISKPAGFVLNGNKYNYTESNQSNLKGISYPFLLHLDTGDVKVGDTLKFVANIISSDADSLNNKDTLHVIVRGPYDPNHKFCYPTGAISAAVREIEYTIEFQNTGTAYASKVVVIDTVDTRLPLKEIRMTGTSHPGNVRLIVRNNVLIWVFESIYLPDSSTDLLGSKGYISYKAQLLTTLPVGERITNRAYIYFDYEDPIVTNEAVVFRKDSSDQNPVWPVLNNGFYIFPNPSWDFIVIFCSETVEEEVEIMDATGKLVMSLVILPEQKNLISVAELSPGMYFIRSGSGYVGKFIKQ